MFEFTDNEQFGDVAHVENIVASYKRMGFTTALDDFEREKPKFCFPSHHGRSNGENRVSKAAIRDSSDGRLTSDLGSLR